MEAAALTRIMAALEANKPARSVELSEEEAELGAWVGAGAGAGQRRGRGVLLAWQAGRASARGVKGQNGCSGWLLSLLCSPPSRRPPNLPRPPSPSRPAVRGLYLLTSKPLVYAANVAEDDLADPSANPHVQSLRAKAAEEGSGVVVVSAQVRRHAGGRGAGQGRGGCTLPRLAARPAEQLSSCTCLHGRTSALTPHRSLAWRALPRWRRS